MRTRSHRTLVDRAIKAIDSVYSDSSVSRENAARSLQTLGDVIRARIDAALAKAPDLDRAKRT